MLNIWLLVWICDWKINGFGAFGENVVEVVSPKNLVCFLFWQLVFIAVVFLHRTPQTSLAIKAVCPELRLCISLLGELCWLLLLVCSATVATAADAKYKM